MLGADAGGTAGPAGDVDQGVVGPLVVATVGAARVTSWTGCVRVVVVPDTASVIGATVLTTACVTGAAAFATT